MIAYADSPGELHADGAAESLFADAFARNVLTPDRIGIEAVMARVSADVVAKSGGQQRPWYQTSLKLPIYFRADIVPADEVATVQPSPSDPYP